MAGIIVEPIQAEGGETRNGKMIAGNANISQVHLALDKSLNFRILQEGFEYNQNYIHKVQVHY